MKATIFNKVFGFLMLFLVTAVGIFLGSDIETGDIKGIIVDGVLLLFWAFGLVFFHSMALKEQASDIKHKHLMEKLDESIADAKSLIDELVDYDDNDDEIKWEARPDGDRFEDDRHHQLSIELHAIIHEVSGHELPTASELKTIKRKFETKTGHAVHFNKVDDGIEVKISKTPKEKVSK